MKLTLVQKLLLAFICLLLVSLVSVAWVYYSFYSSHVEELAQKNQETAFGLIFDSVRETVADSTPAIDVFIRDSVEENLDLFSADEGRYDFHDLTAARLYRELPAILSRYRVLVAAIDQFASGQEINKLVIYDKEQRARVVYLQDGERKHLGVYLGTGSDARFIPYGTQQLSELGGQLVQFLSPEELGAMVQPSLPAGISSVYEGDIPDKTVAGMGHFGSLATVRFTTPIMHDNIPIGLSEIDIGLRKSDVARFANYSHTEINIFAGERLSVGTLPEYVAFDLEDLPVIAQLDFGDFRPPKIVFSEVTLAGERYLQGKAAVGAADDFLVLTANYPEGVIARERAALMISTGSVVLVIGVLSFLVSGIISTRVDRFIQQILNYLAQLADGDVPEKMGGPFKGEFGAIKENFNALIANYGETVEVAGKIANGDLDVHLKERSEQDMLSRALNTMAENLQQARNTLEQRVIERTAQLAESEERYELAEEAANIGTWDWNILSGDLHWSEKIYTLLGLAPGSFPGTYDAFIAAVHPDDRQFVADAVNAAVEKKREYDIEHRVVWPEGSVRWVSEKGAVFYNDSAEPVRMLGVVQDITERTQAKAQLQQAHDELEDRVAERTTDLEAANLRLQELDQLKSMFIASMSHELRTPLNSIIGFSGMLVQGLSGELNSEQKNSMERIHRAGNHLLGLISDVIDISKIEAGRIEAFPERFPLKELVDEAVETIRLQADKKGLALEVQADVWPQMNTDRKRLLQCLLNYLSNAVKFTETGKVILAIALIGDTLELRVSDTGIGIAEEDIPKLFEAFERLETHLRVKAGGTGLGLYLTKKITEELLHGSVSVESRLNEGSVFGLRMPLDVETVALEGANDS